MKVHRVKFCTVALFATLLMSFFSSFVCARTATMKDHDTNGPDSWAGYIEGLLPLGEHARAQLTDPDDVQLVQELYRHIYLLLSQGFGGLVYQDTEQPDFWPQFNTMYDFAVTNVDDTYYTATIEPDGVYKITGYRGTVYNVDFQIGSEQFFHTGLGKLGPALNNYDLDHDITIDDDGMFEFVLSAERPDGYRGDWLALDPRATHIFVRQVFYDWDNEVTGRYAIERMDKPVNTPRESAEKIRSQLQNISEATTNWVNFALGHSQDLRQRGMINRMGVRDFSQAGGVTNQVYMNALYDIQADEALILELEIPERCYYWSFVIYDEIWHTTGWMNRQASINGHAAHIDSDGKFRAVISAQDPGVPNWLDNAGYQRGGLFGRFKNCPGELKPSMKKIKLKQLREQLPADTPTVSARQRDETLRARRRAIQLRRRW